MFALLSPRLWLALALAAALAVSHFMVFRAGKAVVRQEWDHEKTERMAKAVTDSESARLRERVMRKEAENVDAKFQAAKAARLAADRAAADRLQHISELTARLDRAARAAAAAGGTYDPRAAIIGECGGAVEALGRDNRRLVQKVEGLQQFVARVCVSERSQTP